MDKIPAQNLAYELARCYVADASMPIEIESKLFGWIRSRSYKRLADSLDLFCPDHHGRTEYQHLLQVSSFFKKNEDFTVAADAELAARQSFERGERICRITNRRLDYFYEHPGRLDPELSLLVSKVQRCICRVLGDFVEFRDNIPEFIRFTAGATASLTRKVSFPVNKLEMPLECTRGARPYLKALFGYWGEDGVSFKEVASNRVTFVPKNWKTKRTIACEPTGNLPLQLAFDEFCKRKLRAIGVDLSSQEKNQIAALLGSETRALATLDLEMASDTLAFNAVWLLFPADFAEYLTAIRSSKFEGACGSGTYAKFSSMGNGSTFTVETLIFAACCEAVGSKEFCVYGDDIVIEGSLVPKLLKLLKHLGFIVNEKKSHFGTLPVRESCGSYFFEGVDINPFKVGTLRTTPSVTLAINSLVGCTVPEGAVWKLFGRLLLSNAEVAQYGPYDGDPVGNVWLPVGDAYKLGLIRTRKKYPWQVFYKKTLPIPGFSWDFSQRSTALLLWHIEKNHAQKDLPVESEVSCLEWIEAYLNTLRSCSTWIVSERNARRWVHWHGANVKTPGHLYWWSEFLHRLRAVGE